ncbi:hypothetical protein DFH09DRAFT_1483239 [Mycena vulgaris]|nr:hypothetical protein DFH09DRAFT_1483239 [Mycena vulgaris]
MTRQEGMQKKLVGPLTVNLSPRIFISPSGRISNGMSNSGSLTNLPHSGQTDLKAPCQVGLQRECLGSETQVRRSLLRLKIGETVGKSSFKAMEAAKLVPKLGPRSRFRIRSAEFARYSKGTSRDSSEFDRYNGEKSREMRAGKRRAISRSRNLICPRGRVDDFGVWGTWMSTCYARMSTRSAKMERPHFSSFPFEDLQIGDETRWKSPPWEFIRDPGIARLLRAGVKGNVRAIKWSALVQLGVNHQAVLWLWSCIEAVIIRTLFSNHHRLSITCISSRLLPAAGLILSTCTGVENLGVENLWINGIEFRQGFQILAFHASTVLQHYAYFTSGMGIRPALDLLSFRISGISLSKATATAWTFPRRSKYYAGHAAMEVEIFFLLPRSLSDRHVLSDFPHNISITKTARMTGPSSSSSLGAPRRRFYGLVLVDVLHTVIVTADGFHWFVYGFGNLAQLDDTFLNSWDIPVLDSVIAIVAQMFYCWCIYFLRKGIVIPAAVSLVSLTQFSAGIYTGIRNAVLHRGTCGWGVYHVSTSGNGSRQRPNVNEPLQRTHVDEPLLTCVYGGPQRSEWDTSRCSPKTPLGKQYVGGAVADIAIATNSKCRETEYQCLLALFNNRTKESNAKMNSHGMVLLHLPPTSGSRENSGHHGGNGVNVNVTVHVKRETLYDPELNIQVHDAAPDRATRSSETELNLAEILIIVKSGDKERVTKPRVLDIVPLDGNLQCSRLANGLIEIRVDRTQTADVRQKVPNRRRTTKPKTATFFTLPSFLFSLMPRRAEQVPSEVKMPGVPDFRDGIAKWNAAWESLFPVLKTIVGDLELLTSRPAQLLLGDMQEELCSSHSILRGTHLTQEELRVLAVTSVLQPNFCWKTLTPAAREAHMLEGFLRCCLNEPDFAPDLRMDSCDITLASLETANGEGFLALLRKYVPAGDVSLMEDRCVSYLHPEWKEETIARLQRAGREAELQLLIVLRDKSLTDFLYNTILSIIGSPRPPEFAYTKNGIQSSTLDWGSWSKRPSNKKPNSDSPNETPVYRLGKICDGCRHSERDDDPRFMVCKKCNQQLSHKVYYCSRACQISHWPNHKKICGKELTPAAVEIPSIHTEASLADAVFLLERMGPARDGYTRSPALIRQMQYLDAVPTRDYVFFSPTGPKPFMIPLFLLRLVLRLTVQMAIATGDRACIGALTEVVVECFQGDSNAFLAQFVAEFGDVAASKAKAVQAQLDSREAATVIQPQAEGYTIFTPTGKLITRWKDEFVRSKVGSRYAIIANEPTERPKLLRTSANGGRVDPRRSCRIDSTDIHLECALQKQWVFQFKRSAPG